MRLSKSKIMTFLRCRRKFKYQYIDKIPDKSNDYAKKGLAVHAIAEECAKRFQNIDNITSKEIDVIADDVHVDYVKNDGTYDVAEHVASLKQFFFDILIDGEYTIVGVEEEIYDEEYDLKGIVDIVLEDEDGSLSIIDYKSGKPKGISEFAKELCIYKYLVELEHPGHEVVTAGIFFTSNGAYRCINFTESQSKGAFMTNESYQEIFELIDWIQMMIDNNQFQPERQFLCRYCDYQELCERDGGF